MGYGNPGGASVKSKLAPSYSPAKTSSAPAKTVSTPSLGTKTITVTSTAPAPSTPSKVVVTSAKAIVEAQRVSPNAREMPATTPISIPKTGNIVQTNIPVGSAGFKSVTVPGLQTSGTTEQKLAKIAAAVSSVGGTPVIPKAPVESSTVQAVKAAGYTVLTTPALGGRSLVLGATPKQMIEPTPALGKTATYNRVLGGIVTSDGKIFPTNNPNWVPAGYNKPEMKTVTASTSTSQLSGLAGKLETTLTPTVTPTVVPKTSPFERMADNIMRGMMTPITGPVAEIKPVSTSEIIKGFTMPTVELPTSVKTTIVPVGKESLQTFAVNIPTSATTEKIISSEIMGSSYKIDVMNQKISQLIKDRKSPLYDSNREQEIKKQREQLAAELTIQYPGLDANKVLLDVSGSNVKEISTSYPAYQRLEVIRKYPAEFQKQEKYDMFIKNEIGTSIREAKRITELPVIEQQKEAPAFFNVNLPVPPKVDELKQRVEVYGEKVAVQEQSQKVLERKQNALSSRITAIQRKKDRYLTEYETRKQAVNPYSQTEVDNFNSWNINTQNELNSEINKISPEITQLKAETRKTALSGVLLEYQEGAQLSKEVEARNALIEQQTKDYETLLKLQDEVNAKSSKPISYMFDTHEKVMNIIIPGKTFIPGNEFAADKTKKMLESEKVGSVLMKVPGYEFVQQELYKENVKPLKIKEEEYIKKYYGDASKFDTTMLSPIKNFPITTMTYPTGSGIDITKVKELQNIQYPESINPITLGLQKMFLGKTQFSEQFGIIGKEGKAKFLDYNIKGTISTTNRRPYETKQVDILTEKVSKPIELGAVRLGKDVATAGLLIAGVGEALPFLAGKSIPVISSVARFGMNPITQKVLLGTYIAGEGINVGTGAYRIAAGSPEEQYLGTEQISGTITRGLGLGAGIGLLKLGQGTPFKTTYETTKADVTNAYYAADKKLYDMFGKQLPEGVMDLWTRYLPPRGIVQQQVPIFDAAGKFTGRYQWEWVERGTGLVEREMPIFNAKGEFTGKYKLEWVKPETVQTTLAGKKVMEQYPESKITREGISFNIDDTKIITDVKNRLNFELSPGQTTASTRYLNPEDMQLPYTSSGGRMTNPTGESRVVNIKYGRGNLLTGKGVTTKSISGGPDIIRGYIYDEATGTYSFGGINVKNIKYYGGHLPKGWGISESGQTVMMGVKGVPGEGSYSGLQDTVMRGFNTQTQKWFKFKGSDVVTTAEGLTFIKTPGGQIPMESLAPGSLRTGYSGPTPYADRMVVETKIPKTTQGTLTNYPIKMEVVDLTGSKIVNKLTPTQEMAILNAKQNTLAQNVIDKYFVSLEKPLSPVLSTSTKGLRVGGFTPEETAIFSSAYSGGKTLTNIPYVEQVPKLKLSDFYSGTVRQDPWFYQTYLKPGTAFISPESTIKRVTTIETPQGLKQLPIYASTEIKLSPEVTLGFTKYTPTTITKLPSTIKPTTIPSYKLTTLYPPVTALSVQRPQPYEILQRPELMRGLELREFGLTKITPTAKLDYVPKLESIQYITPDVVSKTKLKQEGLTDQITLTELGLTPITTLTGLTGLGIFGIPPIEKLIFPKPGGFGGLPKGEGKGGRRRGVREWTVINPIRKLPEEFFGKMKFSSYNKPEFGMRSEPPLTTFNKMYNR